MHLEFVPKVDKDLFDRTAAAWRAIIAADPENMSSSYYEARFSHCNGAVNGDTFADGGGALCAIIEKGGDVAIGFIVVTYAKHKHLKMLDVYVKPDLNAADREPNVAMLAWIAATAIIGCLEMTYKTFPCNELKMLAGWPMDSVFLTAVTTAMMGHAEFGALFEVSTHGSWVVLKKRITGKGNPASKKPLSTTG